LTFLGDIWRDDADKADKIRLIQQWMGYLLTVDASQHSMLLLYGQGRNGKSVLMQLIHAMIGAGNTTSAMPASLHVASVRARLARALLNLCSDLPLDEVISAGVIKATVAGEPLEASHKHKASHTVYQYARLMMGSNHLPKTNDLTAGYFDRLVILSFNRYFEEAERDPDLLRKLKAEMPGIVAWAVQGLYDLRSEGRFTIPSSSDTLKHAYIAEASPIHMFVDECVEVSTTGETIASSKLFAAYVAWCKPHRFSPGTSTTFGKVLGTLNLKKRKSSVIQWELVLKQQDTSDDVQKQDKTAHLRPIPTPLVLGSSRLPPPSLTPAAISQAH
jgi:putative DNA primase/helicase